MIVNRILNFLELKWKDEIEIADSNKAKNNDTSLIKRVNRRINNIKTVRSIAPTVGHNTLRSTIINQPL